MENLKELALSQTIKNVVKKSKTTSINHRLVEVLSEAKNGLSRIEIVSQITILRLKEQGLKENDIVKAFKAEDKDFLAKFNKLNKTVKNGVDTSLANGKTNANFSYNPKFKMYKIIKKDNKYNLIKK